MQSKNIIFIVLARKLVVFILLSFLVVSCTCQNAPRSLRCELLLFPEKTYINSEKPNFSWGMRPSTPNDVQNAYQLLVASTYENIKNNIGDVWDSHKVISSNSSNVKYNGQPLLAHKTYWWKVRLWDSNDLLSPYSDAQIINVGGLDDIYLTSRYQIETREVKPKRIENKSQGHYFFDFGKAAFGTISFILEKDKLPRNIRIRLGEKVTEETVIDSSPYGTVRYRAFRIGRDGLRIGKNIVEIPPDNLNTHGAAILMPRSIGEVMPFRYCEILVEGGDLDLSSVRMTAVNYPFDDDKSFFSSSNMRLNDVWELCKYSIKATSFCGIYVDGDRERIPYEADAYINQLGHYNVDSEYSMARYTHEYLIKNPTWPTEWIMHSVFMAWMDYMYTANSDMLALYYNDLKAKSLIDLSRPDGLISTKTGLVTEEVLTSIHLSGGLSDIVDWPRTILERNISGERDGYVLSPVNTVVNAFHYKTLVLLGEIANVLNEEKDKVFFENRACLVKKSINEILFDSNKGVYVDGEGESHVSLHGNMFPLAFGLVSPEYIDSVVLFVKSRGMACSVYGAQYLLESMFLAGEDDYAIKLMIADGDRSWPHMIYDLDSTITLEAWDLKYKDNLDWNHAWGAAPANIIPRFVMGVRPLQAGFEQFLIKPQLGFLKSAKLNLPTIKGEVVVQIETDGISFTNLLVEIPGNTFADIYVPVATDKHNIVEINGRKHEGVLIDDFILLENVGSGQHTLKWSSSL